MKEAEIKCGKWVQEEVYKEESLEESSKRTVERYLYLERLLNQYWKRWQREYLPLLSVRSKWQEENPPIREGDIVLVSDDNVSRTKWPMARVEKVHPGKDGLVPTAVKAQKGVFNRPVQRLHRLEIDAAAPQVTREADVPLDGREKPRANSVNVQSVPIRKPTKRVVLPEGGQGGENVKAHRRTRTRVIKSPVRLDL